jgi:hypothetical protein
MYVGHFKIISIIPVCCDRKRNLDIRTTQCGSDFVEMKVENHKRGGHEATTV